MKPSENRRADPDLLRGAGRLGDDPAWPLADCSAAVHRLASAGRAVVGGEMWVLWRDGPPYDIPPISRSAPIYAMAPFIDPATGAYTQPGLFHWEMRPIADWEAWATYCQEAAGEAMNALQRINALRAEMVPEVRDEIWVQLDISHGDLPS